MRRAAFWSISICWALRWSAPSALAALALPLILVACDSAPASPGRCANDLACKGDRICQDGVCTWPDRPLTQTRESPCLGGSDFGAGLPGGASSRIGVEPTAVREKPSAAPVMQDAPLQAPPLGPRQGSRDPIVVILEFGDADCAACASVVTPVQKLLEAYPADVALEWRHDPLASHPKARDRAIAAQAAVGQARFFSVLYRLLAQVGQPLDRVAMGQAVGLDEAPWSHARRDSAVAAVVDRDRQVALAMGIAGTPTFFVNGVRIDGVKLSVLATTVADELVVAKSRVAQGTPRAEVADALLKERQPTLFGYLRTGVEPPALEAKRPPFTTARWRLLPPADAPGLGPKDALVTVVEVLDFSCPFSARYRRTLQRLAERYPDTMRLVVLPAPPPDWGPWAAAEAAFAAQAAGRFWPMHERLFEQQSALGSDRLEALGVAAGVPPGQVADALESGRWQGAVETARRLAARAGARGTPVTFINGRRGVGVRSLEELSVVFEAEQDAARRVAKETGLLGAALYAELLKTAESVSPLAVAAVSAEGTATLGPAEAPVVVTAWVRLDRRLDRRLLRRLREVVADLAPALRLTLRYLPGNRTRVGLGAGHSCAARQGKGEVFLAALLSESLPIRQSVVAELAAKAGLDVAAWARCLASAETAARLTRDTAVARAARLAAPRIFVAGQRFVAPSGYGRGALVGALRAFIGEGLKVPPKDR